MKRRDAVRTLAVAPLAAAFRWTPESVRDASARAREALARGTTYEPKAFTAHEWETVRVRSEEHTSELQSRLHLVCRLLLEKKKTAYRASVSGSRKSESCRS